MFSQKMKIGAVVPQVALPVAIEQFGSKEFFKNYAGWTRNDINALQACTTKAQYDALIQRLSINDAKFNVKEGSKVVDALKSAIPRWCQSPNELQAYAEQIAQDVIDTMPDDFKKSLQETAKHTETEETSSEDSPSD